MSVVSQSARGRGQFNDPELDLSALGTTLWRKRWKILRPTILVGLVTLLAVQVITPRYQSESRVIVESRDNIFLRPEADKDLIDRNTADQESVTSQAQLILSRDLARDVIAKLKLNELPEFNSTLGGVSPVKAVLGMLGIIKNPASMTPEERVLEAYYDRLTVFPVEKSRVIVIDFLSEDPELAARVANTIADDYLQLQRKVKQEQAQNAGQVLAGQIDILRKKVVEAESKVEAYRAKSGLLVGNNNTTLSAQQLGDMNTQLAAARAQKADAEAKARLIREMLKSGQPIEFLRCPQLGADPPPVRAARDVTRAACRAILDAARQPSADQGIAGADRRSRRSNQAGSGDHRALVRKRRQARQRAAAIRKRRASISSRARPRRPTSTTCSCASSSAMPNRSAICWRTIWPNIARRPRAIPRIRRRPMRA